MTLHAKGAVAVVENQILDLLRVGAMAGGAADLAFDQGNYR